MCCVWVGFFPVFFFSYLWGVGCFFGGWSYCYFGSICLGVLVVLFWVVCVLWFALLVGFFCVVLVVVVVFSRAVFFWCCGLFRLLREVGVRCRGVGLELGVIVVWMGLVCVGLCVVFVLLGLGGCCCRFEG